MITPFDDNYKRIIVSLNELGDKEFVNIGNADIESVDVIIPDNNVVSDDYRIVLIDGTNLNDYDDCLLGDVVIDWSDYLDEHYRLKDLIDDLVIEEFCIMCIMN